jgi:hypothetical protein
VRCFLNDNLISDGIVGGITILLLDLLNEATTLDRYGYHDLLAGVSILRDGGGKNRVFL